MDGKKLVEWIGATALSFVAIGLWILFSLAVYEHDGLYGVIALHILLLVSAVIGRYLITVID